MLAAEATFEALQADAAATAPVLITAYPENLEKSWVHAELKQVRNVRPSFHSFLGMWGGLMYSGLELLFLRGRTPWTFKHPGPDHAALRPASECKRIEYPKPDGKISFDLLTNLSRSGTNHEEDQPVHLTLRDGSVPKELNWKVYEGPESRYCPGKCATCHSRRIYIPNC
jgi:electron-transferring-flavoprotein dehydrogenase